MLNAKVMGCAQPLWQHPTSQSFASHSSLHHLDPCISASLRTALHHGHPPRPTATCITQPSSNTALWQTAAHITLPFATQPPATNSPPDSQRGKDMGQGAQQFLKRGPPTS